MQIIGKKYIGASQMYIFIYIIKQGHLYSLMFIVSFATDNRSLLIWVKSELMYNGLVVLTHC